MVPEQHLLRSCYYPAPDELQIHRVPTETKAQETQSGTRIYSRAKPYQDRLASVAVGEAIGNKEEHRITGSALPIRLVLGMPLVVQKAAGVRGCLATRLAKYADGVP